jgi:hypothetical protein
LLPDICPATGDFRLAYMYVFDERRWWFNVRSVNPLIIDITGDPDFDAYRNGGPFSALDDILRQTIILAVAAVVSRTSSLAIGFPRAGTVNPDNARRNALRRLRNHLRRSVWRTMEESGLEGLIELQHRNRPPWRLLPGADDDLLDEGTDVLGELPRSARTEPVEAPPPPDLPDASRDDLLKAIKYVLTGPLQMQIVAVQEVPLKLRLRSADRRGEPYVAGAMTGTAADKARSAIALATAHLAKVTDPQTFDLVAPRALGKIEARASAYLKFLRNRVSGVVDREGYAGLVQLCRSGVK